MNRLSIVDDSLQQSVVKVEKQVTGAPPGLSIVDDYVDVADEKEASPSEKKGDYSFSVTAGGIINSFLL